MFCLQEKKNQPTNCALFLAQAIVSWTDSNISKYRLINNIYHINKTIVQRMHCIVAMYKIRLICEQVLVIMRKISHLCMQLARNSS